MSHFLYKAPMPCLHSWYACCVEPVIAVAPALSKLDCQLTATMGKTRRQLLAAEDNAPHAHYATATDGQSALHGPSPELT